MTPLGAGEFAALLQPIGPFEPSPHLAVAVSGGADSMALALLARDWAAARSGRVTALIIDHGLRAESADEAALTAGRLAACGISAQVLRLRGLARGPALAARARAARYVSLEAACREAGILHLLLGHHAADQAETTAMRMLDRSLSSGMAGMAGLVETRDVRRLRPLLAVSPGRLRATLRQAGVAWVEDPSNTDPMALRSRLRTLRADADGTGPVTAAAVIAASLRGFQRARAEQAMAEEIAARAELHPEGFCLLSPGPIGAGALAALLRAVSGAVRPPPLRQVEALAAGPRPATIGGARILPAGRLRPGAWLLLREAAAMAPSVAAGAHWDRRFRLTGAGKLPADAMLGGLGDDAARFRGTSRLPAAVLGTLPAVRVRGCLFAVPHLRYGDAGHPDLGADPRCGVVFDPLGPAVFAPFVVAAARML